MDYSIRIVCAVLLLHIGHLSATTIMITTGEAAITEQVSMDPDTNATTEQASTTTAQPPALSPNTVTEMIPSSNSSETTSEAEAIATQTTRFVTTTYEDTTDAMGTSGGETVISEHTSDFTDSTASITTTTTTTTTTTSTTTTTPYVSRATIVPIVVFTENTSTTTYSDCGAAYANILDWLEFIWKENATAKALTVTFPSSNYGCRVSYAVTYDLFSFDNAVDIQTTIECNINATAYEYYLSSYAPSLSVNATETLEADENDLDLLMDQLEDQECQNMNCAYNTKCDVYERTCGCAEFGGLQNIAVGEGEDMFCINSWLVAVLSLMLALTITSLVMLVVIVRGRSSTPKQSIGLENVSMDSLEEGSPNSLEPDMRDPTPRNGSKLAEETREKTEIKSVTANSKAQVQVAPEDITESEAFTNFQPSMQAIANSDLLQADKPFVIQRPRMN